MHSLSVLAGTRLLTYRKYFAARFGHMTSDPGPSSFKASDPGPSGWLTQFMQAAPSAPAGWLTQAMQGSGAAGIESDPIAGTTSVASLAMPNLLQTHTG